MATSSADWVIAGASVFAAVGTVGAFVTALVQIRQERVARKRLEKDAQVRERRTQAERVSGWPLGQDTETEQPIALLNASVEPVYRAVVYLVFIQGAAPNTGREAESPSGDGGWTRRRLLSVIPPGMHQTSFEGGWGAMGARPGVEIGFTDRAGVHWLRLADGTLREIEQPAVEYYAIPAPQDWSVPDRIGTG